MFSIVLGMQAQITLTNQTSVPRVGDVFDYHYKSRGSSGSAVKGLSHGGENVTWDFSSQTGDIVTYNYIGLSNSLKPSLFPNANLVQQHTTQYGVTVDAYYNSSANGLILLGDANTQNSSMDNYTQDGWDYLKFPINYGNTFSETFLGSMTNLAGVITDKSGTIEIKADGYGDLVLPYKTLNNVLRIRIATKWTHSEGSYGDFRDTTYLWYSADVRNYIANYIVRYAGFEDFFGPGRGYFTIYESEALYIAQGSLSSDVKTVTNNNFFSIYPNPIRKQDDAVVYVKGTAEKANWKLIDMTGKVLKQDVANGQQEIKIDVKNVPNGCYLLKIAGNTWQKTEKLIINK